jgi:hypothetical protein
MTVTGISISGVRTVWFDSNSHIITDTFPYETLSVVEEKA